jgi:hypothetical protein
MTSIHYRSGLNRGTSKGSCTPGRKYYPFIALGALLGMMLGAGCAPERLGVGAPSEDFQYNCTTGYPAVGGSPSGF